MIANPSIFEAFTATLPFISVAILCFSPNAVSFFGVCFALYFINYSLHFFRFQVLDFSFLFVFLNVSNYLAPFNSKIFHSFFSTSVILGLQSTVGNLSQNKTIMTKNIGAGGSNKFILGNFAWFVPLVWIYFVLHI